MEEPKSVRCHDCDAEMEPVILYTHFPRGRLPARGFKCPRCDNELIPMDEAERVQHEAERLGLYGVVNPLIRRVTKSGNNLAIYIPKEFEERLGLKKGTKVKLWLQEDQICAQTT